MKTTLPFIMLFAVWIWQAHSSGAGLEQDKDRTGSPVADGFCGNCHSGGEFSTTLSLSLHDQNGDTVLAYQGGMTYEVRVKVAAPGAAGFGFQAVALADDLRGAGIFGMPAEGAQVTTVADRDYFEHSSRSSVGEWSIDWTAPGSGEGDLKFYFAGNAVDGDGDRSGDRPLNDSLIFPEDITSSTRDIATLGLQVSPNPVIDQLQINWSNQVTVHQIDVYDFHGRNIRQVTVQPGTHAQRIDLANAAAGLYQVVLSSTEGSQAQKLLKL